MNLPTPATGGPIRVPASTLGSASSGISRSFASPFALSVPPAMSCTCEDRSRIAPEASRQAGRSLPGPPTRISFMLQPTPWISIAPPTVNDMHLPSRKGGLVRAKINCQCRDLFRVSQPAHGLPLDESSPHFVAIATDRGDPVGQRWRLDRAGTDRVAAHPLPHEIRRNRLCQSDHRRLCDRVGEAVRHVQYMASTLIWNDRRQSASVHARMLPWCT